MTELAGIASLRNLDEKEKLTQAQLLVALAANVDFVCTPRGEIFAAVMRGDRREIYPLRGKAFRRWVTRLFADAYNKPPGAQALQDALGLLEARAEVTGKREEVYTRLAERDGTIYVDLGDGSWRALEITRDGWRSTAAPPVYFRRPRGMLPLPLPVAGGSPNELRPFVNLPDDRDWILLVAWLVAALRPRGPYPVLVLQGEQGSGKSTVARMLKSLVDPGAVEVRAAPRDGRDLMIAACHNWTLAFDNLSNLHNWLSDGLCRLATGGGFGTRELWSDTEEVLFDAQRPIVVNGIDDIITRGDLQDRAIILRLPPIAESGHRPEAALWRDFECARPRILGGLLDAVSAALRGLPNTILSAFPRMADFAEWVVAAEPALPWPRGAFLAAYAENRAGAVEAIFEADAVGTAVRELMDGKATAWVGTAANLLEELENHAPERARKARGWPQSPRGLSNRLRRAAATLRQVGIEVVFDERGTGKDRPRLIRITTQSCVRTVHTVRRAVEQGSSADANADGADEAKAGASANPTRKGQLKALSDDADAKNTYFLKAPPIPPPLTACLEAKSGDGGDVLPTSSEDDTDGGDDLRKVVI